MHLANESAGHQNIERRLLAAGIGAARLSSITLAEIRRSILRGTGRVKQRHLTRLAAAVASIKVESFNAAAAEEAAQIMAALENTGARNEWPDVMIAGQAKTAGHVLVTDDAALLALHGVRTENWRA